MSLSPKQGAIMLAIQERGRLSLSEAVDLVGGNIYHNASFYVGQTLARMIKRGLIIRIERGVYGIAPKAPKVVRAVGWWEE